MYKDNLVGMWKLVEYTTTIDDTNESISLFNGKAIGYLVYMPNGFMSVHIMSSHRSPTQSKLEEKIEIAENYGGYTGRYEVHGSTVTHYPEISSVISYLKIPQTREFKIVGSQLCLEYSHPLEEHTLLPERKVVAHSKVIWERVN